MTKLTKTSGYVGGGSEVGKKTVSDAQVSLLEATEGVRFPLPAERACSSWYPGTGLCYP